MRFRQAAISPASLMPDAAAAAALHAVERDYATAPLFADMMRAARKSHVYERARAPQDVVSLFGYVYFLPRAAQSSHDISASPYGITITVSTATLPAFDFASPSLHVIAF